MARVVAARARLLGCLLSGAMGHALGAAVESEGCGKILHTFGPDGITYCSFTANQSSENRSDSSGKHLFVQTISSLNLFRHHKGANHESFRSRSG